MPLEVLPVRLDGCQPLLEPRINYETLTAFGNSGYGVSELMHNVPLADYLLDGLEELRKHKIDVDKLPLTKAKVA